MEALAEGDIQWMLDTGNALLGREVAKLDSNDVIRRLTTIVKTSRSFQCLECASQILNELLVNLAEMAAPIPAPLSGYVSAMMSQQTAPWANQGVALKSLGDITTVFPGALREHKQDILLWSKRGLYDGPPTVAKACACLIVALHSSKKKEDRSSLVASALDGLLILLGQVLGETHDSDLKRPVHPLLLEISPSANASEKETRVCDNFNGLCRILQASLLLHSQHPVDLPLDSLIDTIWKMMNRKTISATTGSSLQINAWQLLLVLLRSCGIVLLPYGNEIEGQLVTTLATPTATPTTLPIRALIYECIQEWLNIRRSFGGVFINKATPILMEQSMMYLKELFTDKKKCILSVEGVHSHILSHCMQALKECLNHTHQPLPPDVIKDISMLYCTLRHGSCGTVLSREAKQLYTIASSLQPLCPMLYDNETHKEDVAMETEMTTPQTDENTSLLTNIQSHDQPNRSRDVSHDQPNRSCDQPDRSCDMSHDHTVINLADESANENSQSEELMIESDNGVINLDSDSDILMSVFS